MKICLNFVFFFFKFLSAKISFTFQTNYHSKNNNLPKSNFSISKQIKTNLQKFNLKSNKIDIFSKQITLKLIFIKNKTKNSSFIIIIQKQKNYYNKILYLIIKFFCKNTLFPSKIYQETLTK